MCIPERTILGIAAVILTIPTLQSMGYMIDGHALARMHRMLGQVASPGSFRVGYMIGLTIMLAFKLCAAAGTWVLLVHRWRRPKGDA